MERFSKPWMVVKIVSVVAVKIEVQDSRRQAQGFDRGFAFVVDRRAPLGGNMESSALMIAARARKPRFPRMAR